MYVISIHLNHINIGIFIYKLLNEKIRGCPQAARVLKYLVHVLLGALKYATIYFKLKNNAFI